MASSWLATCPASDQRRREKAEAGASEGGQQGAVLELADDARTDADPFDPAVDAAAQCVLAGRQEQRRIVEAFRVTLGVAFDQRRAAEQAGGEVARVAC